MIPPWEGYDESEQLAMNQGHENRRMKYKLIQSKVQDKNEIWKDIQDQIAYFSLEDYEKYKPLIYEKDILSIQKSIDEGALTYENLTKWYLYRIAKYENDVEKTLHTILAINSEAVTEARALDKARLEEHHPIYGMPILLKDNINTKGMRTSAGAIALMDNKPDDAFIVQKLKSRGAIILGKVNLSEWAYFFCDGCPVGYSAVGGQTLNPYGPRVFETGGSSSGSGTSMAANYAVAAVGTETSGSILSPSSQNSIVGLKPTIGLLSRSGIVPISSTLDTPGPMTRSVMDNAILLSAMLGSDQEEIFKEVSIEERDFWAELEGATLKGVRLGANAGFMEDSLYNQAVQILRESGAEVIEYEPPSAQLPGFLSILNIDMKYDLPSYLDKVAGDMVKVRSVQDVIDFNLEDTLLRAPYGQARLEGIVADSTTKDELETIVQDLRAKGQAYFNEPMEEHNLDAVLSINNYYAGFAAVAHYPCLTVPMGYEDSEPKSLTFTAPGSKEAKLLKIGYAFEQASKLRKPPSSYSK